MANDFEKEMETLKEELEHLKFINALQELEIIVLKALLDDMKGEKK